MPDILRRPDGRTVTQPAAALPRRIRRPTTYDGTTGKVIIASAARLDGPDNLSPVHTVHDGDSWMDEAWRQHNLCGELRYITRRDASALSRIRFFAARLNDRGEPVEVDDDHPAADVVNRMFGGRHAHSEAVRRIAPHLTVVGVSYIVSFKPTPEQAQLLLRQPSTMRGADGMIWLVLSNEEITKVNDEVTLNVRGQKIHRKRSDIVLIRLWDPDPRDWWEPTSPVRGVLPVLRELEGLTKHIDASINSRLAGAGIMFVPLEIDFPDDLDVPDGQDPLMWRMQRAMGRALKDRSDPGSLVPVVVQVPGEYVDKINHITFDTPFDANAKTLRDEAIRRLALGMDTNPEILLGLGDANHWSAVSVTESEVKMHIEPKAGLIAMGMTVGWLHPVLHDWIADREIDMSPDDVDGYVIGFDTAALRVRPDRSQDMLDAYDRHLISETAMRRAIGVSDDDAPTGTALLRQILLWMMSNAPQLAGQLLTPEVFDALGIQTDIDVAAAIREATGVDGELDQPANNMQSGSHPDNGLPPRTDDPNGAGPAGMRAVVEVLNQMDGPIPHDIADALLTIATGSLLHSADDAR